MSVKQHLTQLAKKKWLKLYIPTATLPAHDVACPECGLLVHLPKMRQGQSADCPRCGQHLVRVAKEPFLSPLAYGLAGLLLMALVVYKQLFLSVQLSGIQAFLSLPEMVQTLFAQEYGFLALVLFLFTFSLPVIFLCLCLYVYVALLCERPLPHLLYATRVLTRIQHWVMVDVFFISALVANIKMGSVAQVHFGSAFWLMPALIIMLLKTAVSVPVHWVYYQIHRNNKTTILLPPDADKICCSRCLYYRPNTETRCAVCGSELFDRRPRSIWLSFCFLLTATILYIPANLLPIMISQNPLELEISTIMSGIIYMWENGDKLIAVIIFSASIAVPALKILSLFVLLYCAKFRPLWSVEKLSLQYRLTEAVGRWSMIDVFVIIILMSAFHTPIALVKPGPAVIYFCLVVIATLASAHLFDMRLIWDKLDEKRNNQ